MNRLRFNFNNLINMLIEERSINKILSRKELYIIHSNQIKRFQIQILMSSKSLTRNDEMILDLYTRLKAFQLTNNLQINLKIEYFRTIDNLHINVKNEHHLMIRRYDYAFFLWNISVQSLIAKFLDQNSYFFIELELRRFHRRFDHFSIRCLQAILDRFDYEINSRVIEYFIKYCHSCQIHEKFSSRFNFTLKNDLEFNFNVIVNILYLEIKSDVNKSVLHVMNETIRFQVDNNWRILLFDMYEISCAFAELIHISNRSIWSHQMRINNLLLENSNNMQLIWVSKSTLFVLKLITQ
jgi:hypothetical protein